MAASLWGEEFEILSTQVEVKKALKKVNEKTDAQKLKSKLTSIDDKIKIIENNVHKSLGHYKDQMLIIRDINTFHNYITKSIENGIIAIDTETNNSLDTLNCKLMGVCIYTPGEKNVYIPINHIDRNTEKKLPNQLTESDIKNEFERLKDTKILMHNAWFDLQVIFTTCKIWLKVYWDSMVAARLLDENEPSAGLKQQYIDKIDPNQAKYDIEGLFQGLPYAIFDPELFGYYASTDAYMTYKLYEYQVEAFKNPEEQGMYKIFRETEMDIIPILAKMTLTGISLDFDYCKRLSNKYNNIMSKCVEEANAELHKFDNKIMDWKLTPQANYKPFNKKGELGKSKVEQLEDPINLDSPTQLAILMYDILKLPPPSKDKPRGTGVEEITTLNDKYQLPLLDLILKKRKIQKLINTFIDKMPEATNPKDNKIHASFASVATQTGRFSSNNPNLQNIPAKNKEVRSIFCAEKGGEIETTFDNSFIINKDDEIETTRGWVKGRALTTNDIVIDEQHQELKIINIIDRPDYTVEVII